MIDNRDAVECIPVVLPTIFSVFQAAALKSLIRGAPAQTELPAPKTQTLISFDPSGCLMTETKAPN